MIKNNTHLKKLNLTTLDFINGTIDDILVEMVEHTEIEELIINNIKISEPGFESIGHVI